MYGIRETLYNDMIELFKNQNIKRVYIFGSRARGDYKESSDIDLAIEFLDSNTDNYIKLYTKLEALNTLYKFDLVDINTLGENKFKNEIKNEWVQIYNKN